MFTLFHFGFEIFKIAIQAAVYSSIILLLKFVLVKITGNVRLRIINFKSIYFSVSVLLFVFSFTYYGDHGLGDDANIPLGHWKTMSSTDGNAYFYLKPNNLIYVDSFSVRNGHLCMASEQAYYDYRLAADTWDKFNSQTAYESYASVHNLTRVDEFKTFYPQYAAYWNGWRFWFLP